MGISFAIPIDEAMRVADQLRATGRVVRGRIGVQIGRCPEGRGGVDRPGPSGGAFVSSVEKGGPADKAGVEAGDIITKVDGKVIDKSGRAAAHGLRDQARQQSDADGVPRWQAARSVSDGGGVRARASGSCGTPPADAPDSAPKTAIGVAVADLTDAQRRELKFRGGVRVESVEGAAARVRPERGRHHLVPSTTRRSATPTVQCACGQG